MTQGELRAWSEALDDARPLTQKAFDDG